MSKLAKDLNKIRSADAEDKKVEKYKKMGLYYTTRSLLGVHNITWYWLCGSRGRGKSYSVVETVEQFKKKYGEENVKCYYFRISDLSIKAMLANKGSKAIDAKIVRDYKLELTTKNNILYNKGKPHIYFYPLVSAAKQGKGIAEYDPDFLGKQPKGVKRFIFIIIDEFMMAEGLEKKSVGNPVAQFKMYIENILRDQEQLDYPAVKIFGCANAVSECSDFLAQLAGFIPERPGRFILKRKHMIVDNIPNSDAYLNKRKRSIGADIMDYEEDSNYTNIVKRDLETLLPKNKRLTKVSAIIKFSKDKQDWFTLWDSKVIKRYTGQNCKTVIAMKRYLDETYIQELAKQVFDRYDARSYLYKDLISQATFAAQLKLLKKQ